jgi:hypothetical protein
VIALVFDNREDAEYARRRIDDACGYPKVHVEGSGADDFRILHPGKAAARLRAAGVQTEHQTDIIEHPRGARFALPTRDADDAEELDASWWEASPRESR